MYVVTFTDDTTYECASYEINDGGITFYDTAGTAQKFAPFHSVEEITNKSSSSGTGETPSGYVVTFVDGETAHCTGYEINNGGVRLMGKGESPKKYVPFHSLRYITKQGGSTEAADGTQN